MAFRAAALSVGDGPRWCRPDNTSASCRLGVMTSARGNSSGAECARHPDAIRSEPRWLHHGVHDDVFRSGGDFGDRLNERGRGHHADLDGAGADVAEDGVYLLGQKFGLTFACRIHRVVFWAVRAVIALTAKTPFMVMVA